MTISASNPLAVGTSATQLNVAYAGTRGASSLLIQNLSTTDTVYLGGSDVTASGVKKGYPLGPQRELPWQLDSGEDAFAIAASGTVNLAVLRGGA